MFGGSLNISQFSWCVLEKWSLNCYKLDFGRCFVLFVSNVQLKSALPMLINYISS